MKRHTKAVLAALLGAVWLFSAAASASASLHECLHLDANAENHACFISLLSHQQILSEDPASAWVVPAADSPSARLLYGEPMLSAGDRRLAPSRAPPQFLYSRPCC